MWDQFKNEGSEVGSEQKIRRLTHHHMPLIQALERAAATIDHYTVCEQHHWTNFMYTSSSSLDSIVDYYLKSQPRSNRYTTKKRDELADR